jgi:acyl-CoA thioesterase II
VTIHPTDEALLGLESDATDPCRTAFELAPHLCRFDGQLYGGTALAVALAAFEGATDRPSLWATVQFVSTARHGERIDCSTEVVAHGRRIDQVQLRGTVGDRLVFSALGSTGEQRDGMAGTGPEMPRVPRPDDGRPSPFTPAPDGAVGWHAAVELVDVPLLDAPDGERDRMVLWARVRDHDETTAAKLGFIADMVPVAVARACGVAGAGTSLDNSLRVGRLVDTEWVLLELVAHAAHGGHGYGEVLMWTPDGTLMATGSQTAKMFAMSDLRFAT